MKILITGGKGQLGNELLSIVKSGQAEIGPLEKAKEYEVVSYDVDKLDISDLNKVREILNLEKPNVVINCAACTNVDGCESNEELAFKVNSLGARNLAICSEEIGAKLVQVSTDYVFSGEEREVPFREYDLTSPYSVYGKTKLMGEEFVKQYSKKAFIVRTSWLYGYIGKNFVKTVRRVIKANGGIGVVCDQRGNPTNANDLAHHLLKLAVTEEYGIYHCTGEGECSWYDFAVKIAEYSGLGDTVTACTTEEYNTKFNVPPRRPEYSSLRNLALECTVGNEMRDWKIALKEYISKVED